MSDTLAGHWADALFNSNSKLLKTTTFYVYTDEALMDLATTYSDENRSANVTSWATDASGYAEIFAEPATYWLFVDSSAPARRIEVYENVADTADENAVLLKANNLNDVASASGARTNLGLGSAATMAASAFDNAGAAASAYGLAVAYTNSVAFASGGSTPSSGALLKSNNLSDLNDVAAAQANLGLGSAATQAASAFDNSGAAASAYGLAQAYTNAAIAASGGVNSLAKTSNLSDLSNKSTARTNLGVGTTVFNLDNPVFGGLTLNSNTDAAGLKNLTALNAAYTAAATAGGGIIQFPVGDVYFGQSSGTTYAVFQPLVAQYSAGVVTLRGAGIDATILRLGGVVTTLCAIYASGVATYGNLVFENFTLDDNHVASHSYSECGPLITMGADASLDNVTWRNIKGINGENLRNSGPPRRWLGISPGNTNATQGVAPTADHQVVTNLLFENIQLAGGNYGAQVNAFAFSPLAVETYVAARRNGNFIPVSDVYIDNIIFRNFTWAGNAPFDPASPGGDSCGIMVGQTAWGGRVLLDHCSVKNSSDDLIELDSITDLTVRKCTLENGHYEKCFLGNLGNIPDSDKQHILIEDCTFIESGGSTTGDVVIGGPVAHGHVKIQNCESIQGLSPTNFVRVIGGVRSLRVKDNNVYCTSTASIVAGYNGANYGSTYIGIAPRGGSGVIEVSGNHLISRHSLLTGGFTGTALTDQAIGVSPSNHKVTIADNVYDCNIKANGGTPAATVVGVGHASSFTDTFGTFTNYINEVGQRGWTSYSSSVLVPAASGFVGKYIRRIAITTYDGQDFTIDLGPFNDVGNYVQAAPGATVTGFSLGSVLKSVATNTMIEGYVVDDGTNSKLHIDKIVPSPATFTDGVLNNDTSLVSASGAAFSYTDVGRMVTGAGISLETYISAYVSPTQVTLNRTTTASGSGVSVTIARETRTQLAAPVTLASRLTASTYTYLRGQVQENLVSFALFSSAPSNSSVPATGSNITYTLTGGDIGTYGDPADGYAGYSFTADDATAKIGSYATLGIGVTDVTIRNNSLRRMSTAMSNCFGLNANGALQRTTKFSVTDNNWSRLRNAGGTNLAINTLTTAQAAVITKSGNVNIDGSIDTVLDKFHAGAAITIPNGYIFSEADSGKTFLYNGSTAATGNVPSTLLASPMWSVSLIQVSTGAMQLLISGSGAIINSAGNTRTNGVGAAVSLLCFANSDGSHGQVLLSGNTAA